MNLTTLAWEWFVRYFLLTSVCRFTRRACIYESPCTVYIYIYTEELYFVTFVVVSYFPAEDCSNTSSENYRTWSPVLKKIISLPGEKIWRSSKKFLRTNGRANERAVSRVHICIWPQVYSCGQNEHRGPV